MTIVFVAGVLHRKQINKLKKKIEKALNGGTSKDDKKVHQKGGLKKDKKWILLNHLLRS